MMHSTHMVKRRLFFDVTPAAEGGYLVACREVDIFTDGETLGEVQANITEVVEAFFFDKPGDYEVVIEIHAQVHIPIVAA